MSDNPPLKGWRSLLFVPSTNERFISKALSRGADAIILDLEDSIPLDEKENARQMCKHTIASLVEQGADQGEDQGAQQGTDIMVRINAPLRLAIRDLEATVQLGLTAIVIPKAETAGALQALVDVIDELERIRNIPRGSIRIIPQLESPNAVLNARAIAKASSRIVALSFGAEDYATAVGMVPCTETLALPELQVAMAAKAEGLIALGLMDTIANISDPEIFADVAGRAARFGFDGALCIHPVAVPVLNQAFSPSPDDIAQAERVIKAMQTALEQGKAAVELDGKMIDIPVYERAKKVLVKAGKTVKL